MTWLITHKPSYDADFVELNKDLQKLVTRAHTELEMQPDQPRGDTIKQLKGWDNVWRYRIGDYRLIYSLAPLQQVVQLLAIGPRGSVYERFNGDREPADDAMLSFGPELERALQPTPTESPAWMQHPEWMQPKQPQAASEALPEKLTPSRLAQWRIPEQYHAALMHCRTDADLLKADVPTEVLGRIMDVLWPAKAARIAAQPDQILFEPEDLERYAAGTLRGFLLLLDDNQRRHVDWALKGPTLVKGGPGSGKSTVALYRVRAIVEQAVRSGHGIPSILFTTYTNALVNYSQSLLQQLLHDLVETKDGLPPQILVTTVDKLVRQVVTAGGIQVRIANGDESRQALNLARSERSTTGDDIATRVALTKVRDDYLLEEFEWVIEGQNCRTLAEYVNANRAGRGIAFKANVRQAVWQLYERYRANLRSHGLLTWGQLRQEGLALQAQRKDHRWDAVVVDEAQDLTPVALAFCVELCQNAGGLFLTADANQSIYNRGFRWQQVHSSLRVTGRTRQLNRNYRSTREIALAALEVLGSDGDIDRDITEQEYVHAGAYPVIYQAKGAGDQAHWLAQQLMEAAREIRMPLHSCAVLTPTRNLGENLAKALQQMGLPTRFVASSDLNLAEHCIKVLTLHSAKGLEFPVVAIAHVESDRMPLSRGIEDEQELQEHLANQRRLLFVGCTRAMRYLFLTHDKGTPSPFLADLSDARWMRIDSETS